MILLKDACISSTKKEDKTNFEFEHGIKRFDYENKKIFSFLNLKNQYLSSGSFSIDDLKIISDTDKTSKLLAFKVNSKVVSLLCVFHLTDEFKQNGFNDFKKSLLSLKDLPLTTEQEKENKIDLIFDRVYKASPLYITIDLNDETNSGCLDFILSKCETIIDKINYVFILDKRVEEKVNLETQVEEEIAQDIQDLAFKTRTNIPVVSQIENEAEQLSFEKEFENFYSIDTSNESSVKEVKKIIHSDNKLKPKDFFKFLILLIKNINLYYVFTIVFSFFVGLGSFASIYLFRTDYVPVAVVLVVLFVLFIFVNCYIYASTYAGVKKHLNCFYKKFLYILTFLISTLIGIVLSYGALHLMNSLNTFINLSEFVFNDYILAIISLPILCLLCCLSALLAKLYIVWHKFKNKHFTKKD